MGLPTKTTAATEKEYFHAILSENLHKGEPITEVAVKSLVSVSLLKIKRPPVGAAAVLEEEDGCRTPTAQDHSMKKNPCPPAAPRKPKSLPSRKRRKAGGVVLLDLSDEIESLFPVSLRKDFVNGKIKKLRKERFNF